MTWPGSGTGSWEVDAGALLGAVCVVVGVWIRAGGFRRMVRNTYFARGLPDNLRNTPFAFIPLGAMFVLLIAGATVIQKSGALEAGPQDTDTEPLGSILILLGLAAMAIGLWWTFRPPDWMKPTWVREYERAERSGQPVPDLSPMPVSPRAYALNWLALGLMATIWIAIGLPVGPLLIGVGFGMSLLLANRPRRRV